MKELKSGLGNNPILLVTNLDGSYSIFKLDGNKFKQSADYTGKIINEGCFNISGVLDLNEVVETEIYSSPIYKR